MKFYFRKKTMGAATANRTNHAFTLVEVIVAMALSTVILSAFALMVHQSSVSVQRSERGLSAQSESHTLFQYLEDDLNSLLPPSPSQSTLCILPETVEGSRGEKINALQIMLLSRPTSVKNSGSLQAISYRIFFVDPTDPDGSHPAFCLFRTALSPTETEEKVLNSQDLHSRYWSSQSLPKPNTEEREELLKGYLAGNVVELKAQLICENTKGERETISLNDKMNWTTFGLLPSDQGTGPYATAPTIFKKIILSVTFLNPEGVQILKNSKAQPSLPLLIQKYGTTFYREISITSQNLG